MEMYDSNQGGIISMYKVNCLNPIAKCGLERLPEGYQIVEDFGEAQAVLGKKRVKH